MQHLNNMLTLAQKNTFAIEARKIGLNENQIAEEIAKKEAELQASEINVTQDAVSNVNQVSNLPDPTAQKQGNFVTNAVKAVVDPALKFGAFVGESVAQASRAIVDPIKGTEEINTQIAELTKKSQEAIKKAKESGDPNARNMFLQESRDAMAQVEQLGNQARQIGDTKETFIMKDGEAISDRGKILETGLKRTAGAASYAIPGSVGVGTTAAGIAGRAAGAGAIAGGLQGFGNSEGKDLAGTVTDTVTGAAVGGATAGVLSGASQAIKAVRQARTGSTLGQKIANAGTEFKKSAYVKAMGRKPIIKEGGDQLLDKMMKAGIKPGSPEEVIYQADDILMDNAGVIFDKADEFKQKGIKIDKEKILDPLRAKLKNAPAKSQPVIQKVLDFVKADLDRFDDFTPAEAYAMKGDYGAFGNWNSTMDSDAITEAQLWEDIYVNINNLMDESFKKNGYDDFRAVNEAVSTAIGAKKYAQRSGNVAPNLNTLGLMDVLAGVAGLATGGGVMGLAAIGGKRVLNSPQFATRVGGALEKAGTSLASNLTVTQKAGTTVIGDILSRLTQRGLVDSSTGSGELVNNPNENSNPSPNEQTLNNNKDEFDQVTSPMGVNSPAIIPQKHPDPRFSRYASKQEMVADAFKQGYDAQIISILKRDWDENAPDQTGSSISPEVQALIDQRSVLSKAGLSTKSVDAKLTQYGFEPAPDDKSLSATTENRVQLATSGLRALSDIEKMIKNDPSKVFKNVLPGKLGARDYDSAAFKAVEGLLRARSGAAIPETEVRRYMNANLPRVGDSQEEIKYKLESFRNDLEDVALSSGSFSAEDALRM